MALKSLSLGVALLALVAAVPAQALTISTFGGEHDAVEVGSEFVLSSAFSGKFEFTLSSLSEVSFFGVSTLPFMGLGLFSDAGDMLAGTLLSPFTGESVTSALLNAGSYYYAPVFPAGTVTGAYAFQSEVSPVPEPSVYAMLLAGLGVVGFMARRRNKGAN